MFDLAALFGGAPRTLGWREWVGLPALDLPLVKAKVDTGARSSALSARGIVRHGTRIGFTVKPLRKLTAVVSCEAEMVDERVVRDSGGHEELRPVIRTALRIGGETREIELTLTDRAGMLFPLLIGRTAMEGLTVRPTDSYLTRSRPSEHELAAAYPTAETTA